MFDWLLPEHHAIAILKHDHDRVKKLFEEFEKAEGSAAKEKILGEAVTELKIHAILEEEIFYPAVRGHVGSKLMNEADEEHHVAKVLIAELDSDSKKDDHREAKFTVLSESIRHHIKEEENEMLPKAKEVDVDFIALGRRMLDRKAELLQQGIPDDAEHAMVAHARGHEDSPAATARRTSHHRERRMAAKKATTKKATKKAGKTSAKGQSKIHKVMKEKKEGTLKSGSGKKVTGRKQAVAIALSEARKSGAKVPKKKSAS